MSLFTEKLKRLRGNTTVEEMVAGRGISRSSIYKAEQTGVTKWETVKAAYGQFFRDDAERLETLLLWAMEKSRERFATPMAVEMALKLVKDECELAQMESSELTSILASQSQEDRKMLLQFIRRFGSNESTRLLVKSWVRVLDEELAT